MSMMRKTSIEIKPNAIETYIKLRGIFVAVVSIVWFNCTNSTIAGNVILKAMMTANSVIMVITVRTSGGNLSKKIDSDILLSVRTLYAKEIIANQISK